METKKECNSCKRDKLKPKEWGLAIFGFYMVIMSIYGTIHFFKHMFG